MGSDDGPWWFHNRQRKISIDEQDVRAFLARLSRGPAKGGEFAVLVSTDDAVRRANAQFRGVRATTDVLSFPDDEPGRHGDVLISAARAARQAEQHGHSATDEVKLLILHGLLHLLGFDHEPDDGAMRREERKLRKRYGLNQAGLIERATA